MKRNLFLVFALVIAILSCHKLQAQNVSINSDGTEPDASAMLDVKSTDKGMLIPRIDFNNVPSTPATGLLIYVTDNGPSGDSAFYYFNGDEWLKLATPTGETDPLFNASVASEINASDTVYWGSKLDSEVDGSTTNEIQTISLSNDTIYLSDGGFVNLPDTFDGKYTSLTEVPTNIDTDYTDDFDGKYTSLTEVPTNIDTDYTDDFDGKYTSLTDVPANIDENATDDVKLTGNQTIAGEKTFSDDATFSNVTATNINASSSVTTTAFTLSTGATDGYVLKSDAQGNASWETVSGDNLGNHTATQNIKLGASTNYLSGDGDNEGILIDLGGAVSTSGSLYVGTNSTIAGNLQVGDASKVANFGNATILGKLDVSDTTILKSNLYVGDPSKGIISGIEAEIHGKLTVPDSIITDAIKITTGAGTGKILTSDANGAASWEDASGSSGLSSFGYVYHLPVLANATVVGGADVPLSNNGPLSGCTHTAGTTTFTVPNTGVYKIDYSISLTAGVGSAIGIAVNGTINSSTVKTVLVSTGEISGIALLSLAAGDVITLRNNSAVALTLDLAPSVGAQLTVLQLN